MMRVLAGLCVLIASPVAAQDQFDLVCMGKYQRSAAAEPKSAKRVYRVDLSAGSWCIEDCSVVLSIFSADQARITFQSYERYGVRVDHYVDRTSGKVSDRDFEGECKVANFSGIPAQRF